MSMGISLDGVGGGGEGLGGTAGGAAGGE